jgi:LuxR family maltose regulon positive regulatory protein
MNKWVPVLSAAKLRPPRTSHAVIERDRLLRQLVDGPAADLILVHGPAGFGKTTLLRSAYLALQEMGTAWLTLDEADNDTEHLLVHLLAALGVQSASDNGNDDDSLGITQINSAGNTLPVMQEYLSKLPEGYTLFLDEFDAIQTPAGLKTVFRALQSLAPGSRMVIGCRTLPTWPLGSMRAQGRLLEIDANQLRFSLDETRQVIHSGKSHLKFDDTLIEHLHRTTEGWIGSIQLAVLSLVTTSDAEGFIRNFTGSNADLADYLAEDLLARQPEAVREFLLKTSLLDNLCAPLCDAICQSDNGTQMLRQLERSNLFLFALDDNRQWYRYHNLFRDFLRGQTASWDKGKLSALHHAAAEWCARNERPSTGINHALASGDMEYAATLINQLAMTFYSAGRLATLQSWIDQLPENILIKYPETQVVYVWCLVTFFQDEKKIEKNLSRLETLDPMPPAIRDEI